MTKHRVLIVEDQADIRELIKMTLEFEDMDVAEADNGDVGWSATQASRPHLVLLDVMMPGSMDGFEVCRRIKADANLKRTKVMMLTARGQTSDRAEGSRSGADAYLTKPFSPKQLLEMVNWLLP